jgi:hypothetical protein
MTHYTCGSNLPTLILHTVHRIVIYARNTGHTTQAVCTWSRWFLNWDNSTQYTAQLLCLPLTPHTCLHLSPLRPANRDSVTSLGQYLPTLTYSSETWSLTTKHISQTQSMEVRYLRRTEGKTQRDNVRNQTIRLGLGAMPLQSNIEEAQLRLFGHVCHMNNERYPKMAWQARWRETT